MKMEMLERYSIWIWQYKKHSEKNTRIEKTMFTYNRTKNCMGCRMGKKTYKRTIQKSLFWDICMVLCIMMILPVNISLLFFKEEQNSENVNTQNLLNSKLEWQVLHELAAVIPTDYEKETLKAQAVIIRTNILADRQQSEKKQESPLLFSYKKKWGENYGETCRKLFEAVQETRGMYLEQNGEIVRVSYFRLSNGSTRNGEECLGTAYTIFTAKECRKDLLSEDFLQKSKVEGKIFAQRLGELTGKEISYEELKTLGITYEYDSTGYVLAIDCGNVKLGGETFRKIFSLPSSDFSVSYEDEGVCIETKGVGNGIGFCQYGANELAKEGKDFIELLNYFFTNIAISKTE